MTLVLTGILVSRLEAQVPSNALLRVFPIRVGKAMGTSFTIERNQMQYLVTARHIVSAVPPNGGEVEIFHRGSWTKLNVDILLPKNKNVDIAVLRIPGPLSTADELIPSSAHMFFGQGVYFLGFPFGISSSAQGTQIPFIKRATLSAKDQSDPAGVIWYFDGFNNPGFSGGPIVFQDLDDKKWKVAAVVKGYVPELAKERVGQQYVDSSIFVNSGILIGYDIKYALDAIDSSPVKK